MSQSAKIKVLHTEDRQPPTVEDLHVELRAIRRLLEDCKSRISQIQPMTDLMQSQRKEAERIMAEVAAFYGFNAHQLVSITRTFDLAWARHVAMTLVREFAGMSLSQIGRLFQRDHGTVLHGLQRVADRCSVDPRARERVEYLRRKLQEDK